MSSNDIAISVRGLSKSYTIAHDEQKHSTLAETLLARLKNPLKRPQKETFWALKDVNFEIKKGEVVGIIGRNGAGKSTLLKILSRITEPTSGQIDLYGRVGSLLEVGTGFHPELTGRENIYLNGAILGMKRSEIARQFDAIVDFAEVEKFLDTPVKRYSSGMYVRLAFAVAAHLNPEILIVDEVLAVGDAEFQRKCIGKMQDVAQQGGRTVLFVSHNVGVVKSLCSTCIYLQSGEVAAHAGTDEVLRLYSNSLEKAANRDLVNRLDRSGNGLVRIEAIRMEVEGNDLPVGVVQTGASVRISFDVSRVVKGMHLWFAVFTLSGIRVAEFSTAAHAPSDTLERGGRRFSCSIHSLHLVPGRYRIDAAVCYGHDVLDALKPAISFDVEPGAINGRPVGYIQEETLVHLAHSYVCPEEG
jgi:lipopolysaccharide transport system ATP-binding protein